MASRGGGSSGGGGVVILVIAAVIGLGIYTGNIDLENFGSPPIVGELGQESDTAPVGGLSSTVPVPGSGSLANGLTFGPKRANDTLAVLPVADERSMAGYSRDLFPHWEAADAFGWKSPSAKCDVREASLLRDGAGVTANSKCAPTAGAWTDPYTGEVIGDASGVDIDHIVPLAQSWRSGSPSGAPSAPASHWTQRMPCGESCRCPASRQRHS